MNNKRVAIITGASKGIGKAIALKLNKENFLVVLVGRNQVNLNNALKEFNDDVITIKADVSKEKETVLMFKKVINQFGCIDVLVNNVGSIITNGKRINQLTKKNFDDMISNNFSSVFFCMREAIKFMKKQPKGGQIININSIVSKFPSLFLSRSLYCAVKSAAEAFSENIQSELIYNRYNIKIANIYPGLVLSGSKAEKNRSKKILKKALKVDDIAYAVSVILNQGENSNITEIVIKPLFNFIKHINDDIK